MDPIHIGSADITVDLFAQIVPTPNGLQIAVSAQQRVPTPPTPPGNTTGNTSDSAAAAAPASAA